MAADENEREGTTIQYSQLGHVGGDIHTRDPKPCTVGDK